MFKNKLEELKKWYRELPDKKKYLELITAFLSVPVLLTVLISNINNLQNNNKKETATQPTPVEKTIVITKEVPITEKVIPTLTVTPTETITCKNEVGPVKITSPSDGQLVTSDQVCIKTNYQVGEYCSVVYSYQINGSEWSDYTDGTICISNLTVGPQELELRVKSSQSDDEVTLIRKFYYKSKEVITPTITTVPTM